MRRAWEMAYALSSNTIGKNCDPDGVGNIRAFLNTTEPLDPLFGSVE